MYILGTKFLALRAKNLVPGAALYPYKSFLAPRGALRAPRPEASCPAGGNFEKRGLGSRFPLFKIECKGRDQACRELISGHHHWSIWSCASPQSHPLRKWVAGLGKVMFGLSLGRDGLAGAPYDSGILGTPVLARECWVCGAGCVWDTAPVVASLFIALCEAIQPDLLRNTLVGRFPHHE